MPPNTDPQSAITRVIQAAASIAPQSQDTNEEPRRNNGLVLVDVPAGPVSTPLAQNASGVSPSGFLNIFVVRGGINMGGGESDASDDDNTTQR